MSDQEQPEQSQTAQTLNDEWDPSRRYKIHMTVDPWIRNAIMELMNCGQFATIADTIKDCIVTKYNLYIMADGEFPTTMTMKQNGKPNKDMVIMR